MSLAGRHLQAEQVVSLDGTRYRYQAHLTHAGRLFAGPIASCPTRQPLEAWLCWAARDYNAAIVDRDAKGTA